MKSGCFGNMMLTFHMNTHRANAHIFCVGFLSFFVASVFDGREVGFSEFRRLFFYHWLVEFSPN